MNEKLMDEKSGKLAEKKSSPEKQEKHSKKPVKDDNNLIVSSTAEIPVSKNLIDQVVGQSQAVEIIKKAAAQKRNVLLVGVPGTGKSMLAQAMSEILPIGELKDILIYPNSQDQNNPRVVTVKAGEGKKIVQQSRLDAKSQEDSTRLITFLLPLVWFIINYVIWTLGFISDVIYAATLILGGFVMVGVILGTQVKMTSSKQTPKLLIDNAGKKVAPFAEATGARAGS
ncbi:MAG TPA: ATP-binding protein, partial [archaeon]|nr:ATP-binding protein [archaeon]